MTKKPPARPGERHVYVYKKQVLVAHLQDKAGVVLPTIVPKEPPPPFTCAYACGQFYSVEWEPDVKRVMKECKTFAELLSRLRRLKYRFEDHLPRYARRPFYRL